MPTSQAIKVLVLYTELMGYTAKKLSVMASEFGAEITAVCKDSNKKTPYFPQDEENVHYLERSKFDDAGLLKLCDEVDPDLIFCSGWEDKGYLPVALAGRKKGIPVVTGLDNQWRGDLRQRVACILSPFLIRKYFSHVQVAGRLQYEYALRLGFPRDHVLMNVYSADTELYARHYEASRGSKAASYPHRFLFVGRLHPNKGLDVLMTAWKKLCETVDHDWELVLVGNGPLEEELKDFDNVVLKGFMQPEAVAAEIQNIGAFVLPSRKEPWGVVVHEFAAAGVPMVLSNVVGAATEFLIQGYNGYAFASENVESLFQCLSKIVVQDDADLIKMGERSFQLSKKVSPELSAATLMSILSL